jgi:hypothetical protein
MHLLGGSDRAIYRITPKEVALSLTRRISFKRLGDSNVAFLDYVFRLLDLSGFPLKQQYKCNLALKQ